MENLKLHMMKHSFLRLLILLPLIISSIPDVIVIGEKNAQYAEETYTQAIDSFDLISRESGWVLAGQFLYWTEDGGETWIDITPPLSRKAVILSVTFLDKNNGWVLFYGNEGTAGDFNVLAHTDNGGGKWEFTDLQLFNPGDPDSFIQSGFLHFISKNIGWLVLRPSSSSNFNHGVLFKTTDAGNSWERLSIPVGEPVIFINPFVGWTSGGLNGGELYRSIDGGKSWERQYLLGTTQNSGITIRYQNPVFTSQLKGFIPVLVDDGLNTYLQVLFSQNGGLTWQSNGKLSKITGIDSSIHIPSSSLSDSSAVFLHPYTGQAYLAARSEEIIVTALNTPPNPSIEYLDMSTPRTGWALQSFGECVSMPVSVEPVLAPGAKLCSSSRQILRTRDGGNSWEAINIPFKVSANHDFNISPLESQPAYQIQDSLQAPVSGKRIFVTVGQGFDKCEIPTSDKLQTWIRHSPYNAVNLYIGGAARSCSNLALNSTYISLLSQQGWKFIPTWVGPQAACYSRPIARMSSDPVISRQQGIAEANAAIEKAFELGLTLADKSGAVIYYDLENYDRTNSSCHNAAKAFIEGWSSQMRVRGNLAGVYSLGPILNDYFGLAEKPDVIWPAHWKTSYYDPEASVWDVYQLSNNYWNTHERIRQYAGGHSETWGGIAITIDSNAIDGAVSTGPIQDDSDNNGNAEIFSIQKTGGQSGFSELYVLNGNTNFSTFINHHITSLPWTNDHWDFDMADFNNDAKAELFVFHHVGTPSGKTEITLLDGASSYGSFVLSVPTTLPVSAPGSWVYQAGNFDQDGIPDVYAIDRAGHSMVTINVLSGASGYQTLVSQLTTILSNTGTSGAWAYTLSDFDGDQISDLVVINKSLGISDKTELLILSGADNFQSYLLNVPTGLSKTGTDNAWTFFMRDHNFDGVPDLFAVNKIGGIQGKTAVHILDGASHYSGFLMSAPTALPLTGSDCNWDFLTGQCYTSNPSNPYTYYFPLAYR